MIRAILFDFNGVLVDDEPVHFELLRAVLEEEGVVITERDYAEEYLGYDDRACFEIALGRAGQAVDQTRVEALIERKAGRYAEAAEKGLRIFPGAVAAVRALAERWPTAICSGALRAEIELTLKRMGVRDQVEAIISAEDTDRCKPDPEGYLLTLDALRSAGHEDLEAGHCLVIEDSLAGIRSAKSAGMWATGVANTYKPHELRQAGADTVLESLTELTPESVVQFLSPKTSP